MEAIELKSNLLRIIEKIQNEQLLQTLYDFLKIREHSENGKLWKSLTPAQRDEVLISFQESENENQLVDAKNVFKKLK